MAYPYVLSGKGKAMKESLVLMRAQIEEDPTTTDMIGPTHRAELGNLDAPWLEQRVDLFVQSVSPHQAALLKPWSAEFFRRYLILARAESNERLNVRSRNNPQSDDRQHQADVAKFRDANPHIAQHVLVPVYGEWDQYASWDDLLLGKMRDEVLANQSWTYFPYVGADLVVVPSSDLVSRFTRKVFGVEGVALDLPMGMVIFEGRGNDEGERRMPDVNPRSIRVGTVVNRSRVTSTSTSVHKTFRFMGRHPSYDIKSRDFEAGIKSVAGNQRLQPLLLVHHVASPHLAAVDIDERHRTMDKTGMRTGFVYFENEITVRPFTTFHVVRDYVILLGLPQTVVRVLETHLLPQGEVCQLCHPPEEEETNKRKAGDESTEQAAKKAKTQARMRLHRLL